MKTKKNQGKILGNQGKIREKSGKLYTIKKWELCDYYCPPTAKLREGNVVSLDCLSFGKKFSKFSLISLIGGNPEPTRAKKTLHVDRP